MPYFHKSELEKKGNSVKGGGGSGERGCRVSRRGREKESFRGKEGRGGLNKAHIDVPNTAAGVS